MDGILLTLNNIGLVQMVLAWAFVACYALALGGMLSARGSTRAGLGAVASAVAFSALAENWVHGALLVLFAVGGMGVFVAMAWLLMRAVAWWLANRRHETTLGDEPASAAHSPAFSGARALRALRRLRLAP